MRMVYEDELRKACQKRALDLEKQQAWIAFRKSLPINRWIERSRDKRTGKTELKNMKKEVEKYLKTFAGEAENLGLKLDMERNYYREAVTLLSKHRQGDPLKAEERKRLEELMIMVDYKDAKLAQQILQSIV